MRSLFAAICCACLAVAGSPAHAEGIWLTDGEGVSQLFSNRSTRVLSIPDVRKLAATHEGGVWAMTSHRLVHISRDGGVRADIDLTSGDYGEGIGLAVDPYDDSAWITTDKPLLLHFSDAGTLAHGTSLPATASALFVALDQTPWLIALGELAHYPKEGAVAAIRPCAGRKGHRGGRPCRRFAARASVDRRLACAVTRRDDARQVDDGDHDGGPSDRARCAHRRSVGRCRADVDRHRS